MATYTMQLREYIEMFSQYVTPEPDVKTKIETGRTKLFDFSFPFFDETKRTAFETDFIRNFYMREIGFETEGLFKFQLETWLNINMPYWNKLFQSELIQFDPMINTKFDVTHTKTNNIGQSSTINGTAHTQNDEAHNDHATTGNDTTGTIKDDGFTRDIQSDNPDGRLALTTEDGSGVIEYASSINESKPTTTRTLDTHVGGSNDSNGGSNTTNDVTTNQTSNGTQTNDEDFNQHNEGKTGSQSYSEILTEYRSTFLRIERDLFKEMNELFMLIY